MTVQALKDALRDAFEVAKKAGHDRVANRLEHVMTNLPGGEYVLVLTKGEVSALARSAEHVRTSSPRSPDSKYILILQSRVDAETLERARDKIRSARNVDRWRPPAPDPDVH